MEYRRPGCLANDYLLNYPIPKRCPISKSSLVAADIGMASSAPKWPL